MTVLNMHQRGTIEPLCYSNTASIVIQKSHFCLPIVAVMEDKRGSSDILWGQMMQNHAKTARKISKTDFYFVTCFYSLRDICIADGIRHPNVELGVVTRCLITDKLQFICESICYIRQGFNKNLSPPAAYGRKSYRI